MTLAEFIPCNSCSPEAREADVCGVCDRCSMCELECICVWLCEACNLLGTPAHDHPCEGKSCRELVYVDGRFQDRGE